jgi:23S rRNA (uridine2552-2'-O)-methyltransferase
VKKTGKDGFVSKGNERYDRHDHFYRRAKDEGYAARSIYKLETIDAEHRLLRSGMTVVDLGCAPGSWLQYAERKVGFRGKVIGIDLLPVRVSFGTHVRIVQGDAFTTDIAVLLDQPPQSEGAPLVDVVLSDMAPNTTGIRTVDQARSLNLCEHALEVARRWLRPGGSMCVKIFEGGEMKNYLAQAKLTFEEVHIKRPSAVRAGSMETYVIALKRRSLSP